MDSQGPSSPAQVDSKDTVVVPPPESSTIVTEAKSGLAAIPSDITSSTPDELKVMIAQIQDAHMGEATKLAEVELAVELAEQNRLVSSVDYDALLKAKDAAKDAMAYSLLAAHRVWMERVFDPVVDKHFDVLQAQLPPSLRSN